MTSKSIDTLVEDIYGLFQGHECDPERVAEFGKQLAETVSARLASYLQSRNPTLRMSNLGKPDRQLWYDMHPSGDKEELEPYTKIKFLYGDILEDLLLFLAGEAGHRVEQRQVEVEVDGIIGHNDAVIDGVVVDCKSASTYAFRKFKDGTLSEDDPFGYMEQLAGYSEGLGGLNGAFLAIDKTLGHVCLLQVPREELQGLNIKGRIEHIRTVVAEGSPPDRCYEPVDEGKSGNQGLAIGCQYCSHKFNCWRDANNGIGIRTFLYSTGPKHLVVVENEPRVPELTF
jgi:hypothetical protein